LGRDQKLIKIIGTIDFGKFSVPFSSSDRTGSSKLTGTPTTPHHVFIGTYWNIWSNQSYFEPSIPIPKRWPPLGSPWISVAKVTWLRNWNGPVPTMMPAGPWFLGCRAADDMKNICG
jgi:hypothetical protein